MSEPEEDVPQSRHSPRQQTAVRQRGRNQRSAAAHTQRNQKTDTVTRVDAEPSRWHRADLHVHTPASIDYQQPGVSYLDILRAADSKGVEILAFTDHNSVSGFSAMRRDVEDLELLERLKRISPVEANLLEEYRQLFSKILVLPGFEFTATLGFHVLAIFPPETSLRRIEHLLLTLHVPEERFGSGEVGATADVLTAYRLLDQAGAIVIGAHANSTNGIAMRGVRFGGQTRIAYTQDPSLHALELTDLQVTPPRRSSAGSWDGSRPGYSRRMHLTQGSDAHRLERDETRPGNLGVGDRQTEFLLPERSFAAMRQLLTGTHFDRVRPAKLSADPGQAVLDARDQGANEQTAFHEQLSPRRAGLQPVLADIVAMANGEGGVIFIGLGSNPKRPPHGVADLPAAKQELLAGIARGIEPSPAVSLHSLRLRGRDLLVVEVGAGAEKPYFATAGGVLIRRNGETAPASRQDVLALMNPKSPASRKRKESNKPAKEKPRATSSNSISTSTEMESTPSMSSIAPRTGVEIVDVIEQDGVRRYSLRDLRSDELTTGIELSSARGLWRYAIQQREGRELLPNHVKWRGDFGYWKGFRHRSGEPRHNLVYRDADQMRVFYGVSEDELVPAWAEILPAKRPRNKPAPVEK